MILYYVQGGGLGHAQRTKHVIEHFSLNIQRIVVVSSNYAVTKVLPREINIHYFPTELYQRQNWNELRKIFQNIFKQYAIQNFWIDTFPYGIAGELAYISLPSEMVCTHLARYLKWENYKRFLASEIKNNIRFQNTYFLEKLHPEQHLFLEKNSDNLSPLLLNYSSNCPSLEKLPKWFQVLRQKYKFLCLIVHSMPFHEIEQLFLFAYQHCTQEISINISEVHFLVISPIPSPQNLPKNLTWQYFFPAVDLFTWADLICTACGFNIMQEIIPFAHKHICLPFERRYDNQFVRYESYQQGKLFG
ncbi:MAG: hypothetical protein NZ551_00975 [Microscillaceae bacterium]|nr:hypothetical protein [Microscillaceae bacterium]MDW8459761.1 hypothetical protein [Cytophagales bacterium]